MHLQEARFESPVSNLLQLVTVTNRLGLLAQRAGRGTLSLRYRVPIGHREGKKRAEIPLLVGTTRMVVAGGALALLL